MRCSAGNRYVMSDLKDGMHAIKMATATSTQDQFIVSTNTPVQWSSQSNEKENTERLTTHMCGPPGTYSCSLLE